MRVSQGGKRLRSAGTIAMRLPIKRRRSVIPADRARGAVVTLAAGPAPTSEPAVCSPAHSNGEEN